jgi:hypothetical protein
MTGDDFMQFQLICMNVSVQRTARSHFYQMRTEKAIGLLCAYHMLKIDSAEFGMGVPLTSGDIPAPIRAVTMPPASFSAMLLPVISIPPELWLVQHVKKE